MFTTGEMAQALENELKNVVQVEMRGRVIECLSGLIKVSGMPARVGDLCEIRNPANKGVLLAEVVGIVHQAVYLMPFGNLLNISAQAEVVNLMCQHTVDVHPDLAGCVLDGYGVVRQPSHLTLTEHQACAVHLEPNTWDINHTEQKRLVSGIRLLDGVFPLKHGQRVALQGEKNTGKSFLLNMLARGMQTDMNVITLIGVSRLELAWWLQTIAASPRREQTIFVVAMIDAPIAEKIMAPLVARAIASYFVREQQQHVGLIIDGFDAHIDALACLYQNLGDKNIFHPQSMIWQRVTHYLESLHSLSKEDACLSSFISCVPDSVANQYISACVDVIWRFDQELALKKQFPAIDLQQSHRLQLALELDARQQQQELLVQRLQQTIGHKNGIQQFPEPFKSLFFQNFEDVVWQDDVMPRLQAMLNQSIRETHEEKVHDFSD